MSKVVLQASAMAIEIAGRELVTRVDLEVEGGSSLGIVGETGSGKSLTCRAFAGTLTGVDGRVSRGSVVLDGVDVTRLDPKGWSRLYGRVVSLVPQNSLSALNPLMRIGSHMTETIEVHGVPGRAARKLAVELLARVGLRDPERVMRQYPHQLSGGMRQRVMIALAIAGRPKVLIADEPTTALDVTVQKEILKLLRALTTEEGMALVLVSHDLGVVGATTDTVAVMYAGTVVEYGRTQSVLNRPAHPYTRALMAARPRLAAGNRLAGIPGAPASPDAWPPGCRFAPRCQFARPECDAGIPDYETSGRGSVVACRRIHELTGSHAEAASR